MSARNRRKPDRESYWFSVGLAVLILAELVLFAAVVHAWTTGSASHPAEIERTHTTNQP